MKKKTFRTLTDEQAYILLKFPASAGLRTSEISDLKTLCDPIAWSTLIEKGLVYHDAESELWYIRWGWLSEKLYERLFPGAIRVSYERELVRLNAMAFDFAEGSNAAFMRQINVVKNLRELVIKAEQ